jgi:hypothetical protein
MYTTVADKSFCLMAELNEMRQHWKIEFGRQLKLQAAVTDMAPGDNYLLIRRGFWFFQTVVAKVYPKVAGGEKDNTFDVLINKEHSSEELVHAIKFVVEKIEDMYGSKLGTIRMRDTLEPLVNDIASINDSYNKPPPINYS